MVNKIKDEQKKGSNRCTKPQQKIIKLLCISKYAQENRNTYTKTSNEYSNSQDFEVLTM